MIESRGIGSGIGDAGTLGLARSGVHGARVAGAIPALTALTVDPDPKVRAEAQRGLARLRQTAA